MMGRNKYAIALCADSNYTDKALTTIKSICVHNRHICFYVLNNDIDKNWFLNLRRKLKAVDCDIVDVKVMPVGENLVTNAHVSAAAACMKFLIPQEITDDVVLYLDRDIIVTADLTHLFDFEFGNNLIAAVNDGGVQTDLLRMGIENTFNAGVMLFNNRECRKLNITNKLLETMQTYGHLVKLADQSILNLVFDGKWYNLGVDYNCLLMTNFYGADEQRGHNRGKLTTLPPILHYASSQKPWSPYCWMQLKDLWWYYNGLEWSEIVLGSQPLPTPSKKKCLTLTNSGHIEELEYLAQSLPDYELHIAAYTTFSPNIMMLAKYPNVKVYPNILRFQLEDLTLECSAYLDINHGAEQNNIVHRMHELGKPVYAFDNVNKDTTGKSHVYRLDQKEEMVAAIKQELD